MGLKFYEKNIIDLDKTLVEITVTDAVADNNGQAFVDLMRNRNNTSGWMTTNSSDAANTTLEIEMVNQEQMDSIILIGHNLKAFTIQYWNGSSYVDFSTAIDETANTADCSLYSFMEVSTSKVKIIITGAQVADADKKITQLIFTRTIGEMTSQPIISPVISKSRKVVAYPSGKKHIVKQVDAFSARVKLNNVKDDNDLTLIETLFDSHFGFIFWPSGGTQTQFDNERVGWRLKDIYLVNVTNEYKPEFAEGFYKHGMPIDLELAEIV